MTTKLFGSKVPRVEDQRFLRGEGRYVDDLLHDDPRLLHAAVLAYASDMTLLEPVFLLHGVDRHAKGVQLASLDHVIWFHRPLRADEWLLYECRSPSASGARGLATGRFFTRDGRMIATAVQEGLVRLREEP